MEEEKTSHYNYIEYCRIYKMELLLSKDEFKWWIKECYTKQLIKLSGYGYVYSPKAK